MKYFFRKALLPDGWRENVAVDVVDHRIAEVSVGASLEGATVQEGAAVPGLVNGHSHAFQYAFAGLSEYRTGDHDSFWTWRKLMYEFLETLTPDDVHRIALELYQRMTWAGYTTVGEFHYLLHQQDGTPYSNVNEMADALIAAAMESGIRICMIPVLYQRGGFDDRPLAGGQLRFGSSHELYLGMVSKLHADHQHNPRVRIGVGMHSLRAVSPQSGQRMLTDVASVLSEYPVHIHVAEQTQEVDDCLAATGKRPIEYLLDCYDVNESWCLIHATHMSDSEAQRLAATRAVACVCPTTEANLGDGVFRASDWLKLNGNLAIGSDSHVGVDPCEELRLFEYAQRLTTRRRAVLCSPDQSCGSLLYRWAASAHRLTGFGDGAIAVGNIANISVVSDSSGDCDRILDKAIFHPNATRSAIGALT